MKIKATICDPGGNITAVVTSPCDQEQFKTIAKKVFDKYNWNKREGQRLEQVGFYSVKNGKPYFSMEGGEFSGNAFRCFAYLALKKLKKNSDYFDVSGSTKSLFAKLVKPNTVDCQMPVWKLSSGIKYTKEGYPWIKMDSISYIILENTNGNSDVVLKKQALQILDNNKLKSDNAVGVLFTKTINKNTISMRPFVYFCKGGKYDMYKETACGTGSTSIGILEYMRTGNSINNLKIIQPSGSSMYVSIKKKSGKIEAYIKGQVKVLSSDLKIQFKNQL